MQTLIFANGDFCLFESLESLVLQVDLIIAADGGAAHCENIGIVPHIVVGDCDSIGADLLERYRQEDVKIFRHPIEKDATDLELALDLACEKGTCQVCLLGALGGRWDMSLANIMLAAQGKYREIDIFLVGDDCRMRILHPGRQHSVFNHDGATVSLLPLEGNTEGVTLIGFHYPLDDHTIRFGSSRGVSNLLAAERATICHQKGVLLCIQQA